MTPFLSDILSREGWEGLFAFSKRQSLLGVVWDEIQDSLEFDGGIPPQILKQWITLVGKIEEKNKLADEVASRVAKRFEKDGFSTLILKGQGLCHYYPIPHHRQTGDVDIWIWRADTQEELSQRRSTVIKYVRNVLPNAKVCYHHAEFKRIRGIDIEVHFTPTWMYSPSKNKILQKYFQTFVRDCQSNSSHSEVLTDDHQSQIPIPTDGFNLVFILIHIFRHIFDEGVGLRQLMDWDMVLRHSRQEDRTAAMNLLQELGLTSFTKAVLYVLREVFNTETSVLLTTADVKEGQWLLKQIMAGGNFGMHKEVTRTGFHDLRQVKSGRPVPMTSHLYNFIKRIRRSFQLMFHYPEESLWAIPWRMWHWIWRLKEGHLNH